MPNVTPFVRPSNERSRLLVRERIDTGKWKVAPDEGVVYGQWGQSLRGKRNTSGYVQYSFRDPDEWTRSVCVSGHLVIWEYVHGPVDYPMQVNHLNGVKDDNRIANLELVTPVENTQHAHRVGLIPYRTVLTASQVRDVRLMLAAGVRRRTIAQCYGVNVTTIRAIDLRLSWTDLT